MKIAMLFYPISHFIQIYLFKTAHILYLYLHVYQTPHLSFAAVLFLYISVFTHLHLSSGQEDFFFFSPPSLFSCITFSLPISPPIPFSLLHLSLLTPIHPVLQLQVSQRELGGVGSVRWLIQSPIAVSAALTNPLSPPHRLLPDPRAICLAAAFSASEPIIQLVSLCNHTLIQTDLTSVPLQCPRRLCLNLVYSMWFTQSLSVCGVE